MNGIQFTLRLRHARREAMPVSTQMVSMAWRTYIGSLSFYRTLRSDRKECRVSV